MSNQNDESQKESTSSTSSLTKSPKKDANKTIDDFLKVMNDIFDTVLHDQNLVHIIDAETKDLLKILRFAKKEYQYICYSLFTRMFGFRSLFTIRSDYMLNLTDKQVIEMFNFLKENKFVDTDIKEDGMPSVLKQLTAIDVKNIGLRLNIKPKRSKDKMIQALLLKCTNQPIAKTDISDIIWKEINNKLGMYAVRINDSFRKHINHVYLLATFTNKRFQNIENFVQRDLKRDFPDFVPENYKVFSDREQFLRYADACELKKTLGAIKNHDAVQLQEIGKKVHETLTTLKRTNDEIYLNTPHLKRFTAESVYCGILTNICETLKTKYADKVQEFLKYLIENFPRSHRIGTWYMLLYDVLIFRKQTKEAVNTIITALSTKKEYILEHQIYEFTHKAQQQKEHKSIDQKCHDELVGLLVDPIHLEHFPQAVVDAKEVWTDQSGRQRFYEIHNSDGSKLYKNAEQVAQAHYIETCGYTDGIHCEGRIMHSFTLFFWEIIYSQTPNIPGTFLSKYQEVPLDMYTTDFYKNRKQLIDKRLKDIAEDWTYKEIIQNATEYWNKYSHISGLGGPICETLDIKFLNIIVDCIGRKILSKIYERLVKDIHQYRSEMPDLFLWNVDEKKAKFVKVKGENDELSIKQQLWLKYLLEIGANVEVCHVQSRGSKRKLDDNENDHQRTDQ
ncbi:unnamed protein product [Diabrotica balteata]|uniref:Fanconi-associated nuclease n=1 Tax=Diabrotica balteata TaxID=107213 RepID=A0A9P0DXE0_DIABA|nr:unnamed protein product [Diabrotica balteata]